MAKLTNKKQLLKAFQKKARKKMAEDGDQFTHDFFMNYLGAMPSMERKTFGRGGHLFEGWLSAIEKSGALRGSVRLNAIINRMAGFRSRDPNARQSANGWVRRQATRLRYHFHTAMAFVSKIERGQAITVGDAEGNKGKKTEQGIGRLYGARHQGKTGMLMWYDGGGKHFAKVRIPSGPGEGVGAFEAAQDALVAAAESSGWVRK